MIITQTGTFNNVHYALRSDCKVTLYRGARMLEAALPAMKINYIEDLHKGRNLTSLRTTMDGAGFFNGTVTKLAWGLGDTEADALAKL